MKRVIVCVFIKCVVLRKQHSKISSNMGVVERSRKYQKVMEWGEKTPRGKQRRKEEQHKKGKFFFMPQIWLSERIDIYVAMAIQTQPLKKAEKVFVEPGRKVERRWWVMKRTRKNFIKKFLGEKNESPTQINTSVHKTIF